MEARKVIIVGASSGIGRALALYYAKAGCKLGITGRRTALLEKLKDDIASFTHGCNNADLVYVESFDTMGKDNIFHLHSLVNKLGGLDLLIYNSGYGEVTEVLEWEVDKKIV